MNIDILIVEDRENWREALVGILQDYKIKPVSNFSEAKEVLASHQVKLAIIDINLVGADLLNIDGLKLLDEIDKADTDTKVLIITGYPTKELERMARMSKRLVDFISKDKFDLQQFEQAVKKVMLKQVSS